MKKILLYIAGPGAIMLVGVSLFIQLFTVNSAKIGIIIGLVIFFFVFLPFYTIENIKSQDRKMKSDKKEDQ